MSNLNHLLKQAQQMQQKIAVLQKELENRELDISSGGGAIKIRITGKQELKDIKIDKEAVDPTDITTLEELVKTAVNQAIKESQEMVSKAMSKVTGGLNLPGIF
jgi:DNA-binding YbaB/EbfC family protein